MCQGDEDDDSDDDYKDYDMDLWKKVKSELRVCCIEIETKS